MDDTTGAGRTDARGSGPDGAAPGPDAAGHAVPRQDRVPGDDRVARPQPYERRAPESERRFHEAQRAERSRTLGADHPETLGSAADLVIALLRLGEFRRATELAEDTLVRQRRALGDDHPDTVISAVALAIGLRGSGEHARARRVRRWVVDPRRARWPVGRHLPRV